jgi:nucleoside-diphosphate-sugar epimerase
MPCALPKSTVKGENRQVLIFSLQLKFRGWQDRANARCSNLLMKIAIIGPNSFLARHLIAFIKTNGDDITRFERNPVKPEWTFNFPEKTISSDQLLEFDIIYYCAGSGVQADTYICPEIMYELNGFFPIRMLAGLEEKGYNGKFVTFGSYFEIGNQDSEELRNEEFIWTHKQSMPTPYCFSKNLLSRYIGQRFQGKPLPFVLQHFILPTIYGKGENSNRLFPYLFRSATSGTALEFTPGTQVRQYTHVTDIADFLFQTHMWNESGIFNLSNPEVITVRDLIEQALDVIQAELGIKPEISFGKILKRDTSMKYLGLDTTKIHKTGGFVPKISLKEGLRSYFIERKIPFQSET